MRPRKKQTFLPTEPSVVSKVSLVPRLLSVCAFSISFILPNLVFSGPYFFDALHLMKWATSLAPIAVLGVIAGYGAVRHGPRNTQFRLDGFAAVWLLLLVYVTIQPLWARPRSMETFYQEWFFFASLWLVYVLASLLVDKRLLRFLLWGSLCNAACSVIIAELQSRGIETAFFFIFPSGGQGGYIANTGQQNMFALWMAISGLNGVFLLFSSQELSPRRKLLRSTVLLSLLALVFYGLVSSTSRSGILSLGAGFMTLALFFMRNKILRHLPKALCVVLAFALILLFTVTTDERRSTALTSKLHEMIENPLSLAYRDSIWATSWTMFSQRPFSGVGLGQFKWHYMDAQNEMIRRWPHMRRQFTFWAHNEFLQWMAESGVVGALLMFFLWFWWGAGAFGAFKKQTPLSDEALWGSALVSLFLFNALWTRPFHRIENALWLALAFAVTNREILRSFRFLSSSERVQKGLRLLAGLVCAVSFLGLAYLGNGIYGNRLLRLAADGAGGDAAVIMDLYRRAYSSPMVQDLAEKQIGYFSVRLGEATGNPQMIIDGLNALIRFFEKQPHVDELKFLLHWGHRIDDQGLVQYMRSFIDSPTEETLKSE